MVSASGTGCLELLPVDRKELAPAYLGHPYLTESEGYNTDFKSVWSSFDALDPRNIEEGYGKKQIEGVLDIFGKVIAELMNSE